MDFPIRPRHLWGKEPSVPTNTRPWDPDQDHDPSSEKIASGHCANPGRPRCDCLAGSGRPVWWPCARQERHLASYHPVKPRQLGVLLAQGTADATFATVSTQVIPLVHTTAHGLPWL